MLHLPYFKISYPYNFYLSNQQYGLNITSLQNNKCLVMQVETDQLMEGTTLDKRSSHQNGSAIDEDRLAGNEVGGP